MLVEDKINDVTYRIRVAEKTSKVLHYDLMKPYVGRDIPTWVSNLRERIKSD